MFIIAFDLHLVVALRLGLVLQADGAVTVVDNRRLVHLLLLVTGWHCGDVVFVVIV